MKLVAGPIIITHEAEMTALGRKLAPCFAVNDIVYLEGDLGAGKTTFVRAIVQARAGEALEVPSPTFSLVQSYELVDCEIWHMDLYRLEEPEDLWELGVEDAFENAICFFEWPEKAGDLLPRGGLKVLIKHLAGSKREISLLSHAPEAWQSKLDTIDL